ncbi:MAG: FAD-dependent oxidoreductase [Planctomycetaceae bacterium]|nr:FAD-dependent oxidoreductase [Planctomycetaceae bacterium]
MKAKILIVGGGVMGSSIALNLARHLDPTREPVVLLERGDLAGGSSGHSGGLLRQHYAESAIASMARDSIREYAAFESRTGRSLGFRRCGVLTLAGPSRPEAMARLERNVAAHAEIGIRTEVLDAAGIRALVPGIEVDDRAVAAWEPTGGVVDPVATVREFAALARTYGAVTRLGVTVSDLLVENGRFVAAITSEGRYDAERVVIVAGAWSSRFLRKFGAKIPVRVARVETHFFALPGAEERNVDAELDVRVDLEDPLESISEQMSRGEGAAGEGGMPVILDLEYGFYTRAEPEQGRVRVSPIDHGPAELYDEPRSGDEPTPERAAWARSVLAKRLPAFAEQPERGAHVSWFPISPDGRAIVGPVPGLEGVYVASGFADHGFKLAPAVGEGVSQMLRGEPVSGFDSELFSPERFAGETDATWSAASFL